MTPISGLIQNLLHVKRTTGEFPRQLSRGEQSVWEFPNPYIRIRIPSILDKSILIQWDLWSQGTIFELLSLGDTIQPCTS
jgi:hypothetical protein